MMILLSQDKAANEGVEAVAEEEGIKVSESTLDI